MDATKTEPRSRKIAHNIVVGKRGESIITNYALREGITPNFPSSDNCYDMLTDYLGLFNRVQIRASGWHPDKPHPAEMPASFSFSILRTRRKKRVDEELCMTRRRHFRDDEIDAFIFAHVDYNAIFIIPVDSIDLSRTKYTVYVGGEWHNAWWVLK